jgi:23S rRNA pseudouridine1911/1915/1917 synthase
MSEEFEVLDEEQELYEHYRIVADKGQSLLRIDKFLMNRLEGVSRSKIQAAAHAGNILVNDKPVKPNYKAKPNDIISIVLAHPPREIELIPQDIPINIVHEDDDIIVVNKDPGMVVHPGYGNYTGTLVNALIYHFQQLPNKSGDITRPLLVHRIDKNTSGIILVAKTEIAQAKLAKEFFNHTIKRKYHALVWGDFKEDNGTITGNIGRNLKDRKIMAVFPDGETGREAITHYKVLERFGYITLIECQLETGRTHQIRVHLKYAGHPLFNDDTYGGNIILKGTTFTKYKQFIDNCFSLLPRQALHAKSLGFVHPATGKEIFFDSELPQDMQAVIEKWKKYISDKKNEIEE